MPPRKPKEKDPFIRFFNPKIEKILQNTWVKKENSKGKISQRLIVATTSCIYTYKSQALLKNVKLTHSYPWVNLTSIYIESDEHLIFTFGDDMLSIYCQSSRVFLQPIVSTVITILPKSHPAYRFLQSIQGSSARVVHRTQFIDLLLSFSKMLGIQLADHYILSMKKQIYKENKIILCDNKYDEKFCQGTLKAYLKALSLVENLKVVIGGQKFPNLFQAMSVVALSNSALYSVTIKDYSNAVGFIQFMKAVHSSSISSLSFDFVTFSREMSLHLAENLQDKHLLKLKFNNCHFNTDIFQPILDHPSSFTNVDSIALSNEHLLSSNLFIENFLKFTSLAQIKKITLKNLQVEITEVIPKIIHYLPELVYLNLSQNNCKATISSPFLFPTNLKTLILSHCHWEGETFSSFFTNSFFESDIRLDMSNTVIDGAIFFPETTPIPIKFEEFIFSNSHIPQSLLSFLTNAPNLNFLEINDCSYDDPKIILFELNHLLAQNHLRHLQIEGTFKGISFLTILKQALIECPITKLSVSRNNLGNDEILVLGQIISKSNTIHSVHFDQNQITSAEEFIEFVDNAATSKSLRHLAKPKRDLHDLYENCPKSIVHNIKFAWEHMRLNTKSNPSQGFATDASSEMGSTDTMSISEMSFETNDDFSSTNDLTALCNEEVCDVQIDIGLESTDKEWDALHTQFGYSELLKI